MNRWSFIDRRAIAQALGLSTASLVEVERVEFKDADNGRFSGHREMDFDSTVEIYVRVRAPASAIIQEAEAVAPPLQRPNPFARKTTLKGPSHQDLMAGHSPVKDPNYQKYVVGESPAPPPGKTLDPLDDDLL